VWYFGIVTTVWYFYLFILLLFKSLYEQVIHKDLNKTSWNRPLLLVPG
jgi:hypothetical protein